MLGAGFTKAFVPGAPLLVDDYRIPELLNQFRGFEHAARVLELAVAGGESRVDLEALLTRLSGMPYDSREALREFAVLESALQHESSTWRLMLKRRPVCVQRIARC